MSRMILESLFFDVEVRRNRLLAGSRSGEEGKWLGTRKRKARRVLVVSSSLAISTAPLSGKLQAVPL